MTLREILHAHIPTLTERSTLRDAVDKMDIYQFPALAIVNDEMAPIAVITEGDICRAIQQKGDLSGIGNQMALKFATMRPVVARPDEEVSEALHRMIRQGLTVLPIAEHGRLNGIVLRIDLMQAILMDCADSPE